MTEGLTAEAVQFSDDEIVVMLNLERHASRYELAAAVQRDESHADLRLKESPMYDRRILLVTLQSSLAQNVQLARQLLETQNALRALLDHHSAHRYHWEDFTNDCPDANATARAALAEHTETPG